MPKISFLHTEKTQSIFATSIFFALLIFILSMIYTPKFMAYAPSVLGLIGFLIAQFLLGLPLKIQKRFLYFLIPVFLLGLLSALWSIDVSYSLKRAFKIGGIFLGAGFLLSLLFAIPIHHIKKYMWLFPVTALIAMTFIISEIFFAFPFTSISAQAKGLERVSNAVMNRSIFCLISLSFLAMLVIAFDQTYKKIKPYAFSLLIVLMLTMIAFSEAQSSQLGFLIASCVAVFYPKSFKYSWLALGIFLGILILSAPYLAQFLFTQFADFAAQNTWLKQGYAAYRLEIWDFIARYALESPFWGYGIEATRLIEDFDTQKLYHPASRVMHPHNFALQIWMEFGVLGALLATGFFTYLFYRIHQLPGIFNQCALGSAFVFISVGATGYGLWQSWWLGQIIFVLSLFIVIFRCYQSDKQL